MILGVKKTLLQLLLRKKNLELCGQIHCWRSASMGKAQENLQEPKHRGISLVPAHPTDNPSAVLNSTELETT